MLLQINHITKTYNVNSSFKRKKQTIFLYLSIKETVLPLSEKAGAEKAHLAK